ncbi:MAG: glucose-6-phosphate isomerase [Rhodovibrionaceae bacterium]|nr:glucose-6-phosphate isomerase [Rhodovibrionaceae bacterium]
MVYQHITENCFAGRVGEGGLSDEAFERLLEQADHATARLRDLRHKKERPFLALPAEREDLSAIEAAAGAFRDGFDDVLVLGTGGSSLGGRTLVSLTQRGRQHSRLRPRLHFLDNIDPDSFEALFEDLDPERTGIIAISKSGSTAETLCQFAVCLHFLVAAIGEDALARKVLVITEDKPSPLRKLAESYSLPFMAHDPDLGGRFSVLSLVGLVPATLAGIHGESLREGAEEVLDAALEGKIRDSAPAVGACIAVGLLRERMITQSVLMPYIDRLGDFGFWYRQLWAESLGKDGTGTTPIRALGTVDQHSQLQLYLDGPRDKMFTLIRMDTAGQGPKIDPTFVDDPDLAYLSGRKMGDLLDAEARATAATLVRSGRPVREIVPDRLDSKAMGALLMHFMLETAIAAELLGVDAYGQPAVEDGKKLTRERMTKSAKGAD